MPVDNCQQPDHPHKSKSGDHGGVNIDFRNDSSINLEFGEGRVFRLLKNLNPNKAPGPDGIHGRVLKNCASSLALPLSLLFTVSYRTGQIPSEWKSADIVPVFKKGDKKCVENYRPISLLCIAMKVFERCIRDELTFRCSSMLDKRQHGFLPRASCTTQMVPFVDSLAVTLNDLSRADVIYFDFAKAFDSVSHDVILHKLKTQYGIDGILLKFLKSYLEDRIQRVVVGGAHSGSLKVDSGVPQGSILGPTLFIMFINDMISQVSAGTNIALYADDTKIWRKIESWSDHEQLQKDITALHSWSVTNKMVFHPNKCKVLVITLKHIEPILPFDRFGYHLDGQYLDYVSSEKDLGVHISSNLHWGNHCKSLVSKARSRLGLITRTLHYVQNKQQKRVFYLALVRSLFEHCCVVWRPHAISDTIGISMLQKRAVKWILSEQTANYTDSEFLVKQNNLDLLPLESRMELTDVLLFHQIVYKQVNIDLPSYLLLESPENVRERGTGANSIGDHVSTSSNIDQANIITHRDTLHYKSMVAPKVDSFKYSYFYRVHLVWNSLPLCVRVTEDHNKFKRLLKEHLWKLLLEKPD